MIDNITQFVLGLVGIYSLLELSFLHGLVSDFLKM